MPPASLVTAQDLIFGLVGQQWSSRARAGVEEALYEINNRNDILSNYKLKCFVYMPIAGIESQVLQIRSLLFQWQYVSSSKLYRVSAVQRKH